MNQSCCTSKWIASFQEVQVSSVISGAQAATNFTAQQSATHWEMRTCHWLTAVMQTIERSPEKSPRSMGADEFVALSGIGSCTSKGDIIKGSIKDTVTFSYYSRCRPVWFVTATNARELNVSAQQAEEHLTPWVSPASFDMQDPFTLQCVFCTIYLLYPDLRQLNCVLLYCAIVNKNPLKRIT